MIAESEFGGKVNSPNATSGPTFVSLSNNRKVDPLGARYVTPFLSDCAGAVCIRPGRPPHRPAAPVARRLNSYATRPRRVCNFDWRKCAISIGVDKSY